VLGNRRPKKQRPHHDCARSADGSFSDEPCCDQSITRRRSLGSPHQLSGAGLAPSYRSPSPAHRSAVLASLPPEAFDLPVLRELIRPNREEGRQWESSRSSFWV
jgi:hypothetical protein